MMSDLLDENNENKLPEEESISESVSLDNEREQSENTSEIQFSTSTADSVHNTVNLEKKIENIESAVKADFENTQSDIEAEPTFNREPVEQVVDTLPKLNTVPRESGASQPVSSYYSEAAVNPYQNNAAMNYRGAMPAYEKPPKAKMNPGLKAYLIIITGLTIIFLLGFIFECIRVYNNNGLFGGDLDRFIDPNNDFGYSFGFGDFYGDDEDDDDYGFGDYNFTWKDDSDNAPTELKEAPDRSTVVNKAAANISVVDQPEDIDDSKYTARKAYKRVENSVVNVVVYDGEIGNEDFALGSGTGIIVSEDGYIVTNSHVLNDSGSYGVEIILTDGSSYIAAVVGYDSRTDIAVVKVDAHGLTPVEFVNSDQLEVGQDAIAVGNPGGIEYSNSLTKGCVSALNRTISSNRLVSYIQTDAAINPGNSGGPLLNSAGQVMGITTIKIASTEYEGMGFAIPSNTTVSIINDLIGQGYVSDRVRIGITGIASSDSGLFGIPGGIVISDIADDSPFKDTDAKVNDIITAIDGQQIESFTELFAIMANYRPGDEATVSLYRPATSTSKSKSFDVTITFIADNGETQQLN